MRRKILSLLLSAALVFGLVPAVPVFAESQPEFYLAITDDEGNAIPEGSSIHAGDVIVLKVFVRNSGGESVSYVGYDYTFAYNSTLFQVVKDNQKEVRASFQGDYQLDGYGIASKGNSYNENTQIGEYTFQAKMLDMEYFKEESAKENAFRFLLVGHIAEKYSDVTNMKDAPDKTLGISVPVVLNSIDDLEARKGEIVSGISSLEYNGEEQASAVLNKNILPVSGRVDFSFGETRWVWDSQNSTVQNVPKFKNAGVYDVSYTISAPGYETKTDGAYSTVVTQKPVVIAADNKTSTVNAESGLESLTYVVRPELCGTDRFPAESVLKTDADLTRVGTYRIHNDENLLKIVDEQQEDMTANYAITFVPGTYVISTKKPQALRFHDGDVNRVFNLAKDDLDQPVYDTYTYTAVLSEGDGAIAYKSNNESVATVEEATGKVTIVGAGEAIITATAKETGVYASASAEYKLLVAKKEIAAPVICAESYAAGVRQTAAVEESDYYTVVKNEGGINAGTYDVVLRLKHSGYMWASTKSSEDLTLPFVINPVSSAIQNLSISNVETDASGKALNYWIFGDGKVHKASAVVLINGEERSDIPVKFTYEGTDGTKYDKKSYSPSESEDGVIGNYILTATVQGTENYSGSEMTKRFAVKAHSLEGVTLEFASAEFVYDGTVKSPGKITATLRKGTSAEKLLKENVDYTVSGSTKETNAGTNKVTIIGKGNYYGYLSNTWTIAPMPVTDQNSMIVLEQTPVYNEGQAVKQGVASVTVGGKLLTEGVDYTITDNTGVDAGDYTLKVVFQNNYTGIVEKTWKLAPLDISGRIYAVPQTYKAAAPESGFKLNEMGMDNFRVEYKVGGTWQSAVPTIEGSYDVRVTRDAEQNYKAVSKVIEGGLVLTAKDPQKLTFADSALKKTVVDVPFTNVLSDAEGNIKGTVTYRSSEESVATVDVNGEVTIQGIGTTTITAVSAAQDTDTFATTAVSYLLTVTKAIPESGFTAKAEYGMTLSDVSTISGNAYVAAVTPGTGEQGKVPVTGTVTWKDGSLSVGGASSEPRSFMAHFVPDDSSRYEEVDLAVAVSVERKTIEICGATIENRAYDGTRNAQVTNVEFDGLLAGDTLSIGSHYTVSGQFDTADRGLQKDVSILVSLVNAQGECSNYKLKSSVWTGKAAIFGADVPESFKKEITVKIPRGIVTSVTTVLPEIPEGMAYGEPGKGAIQGRTFKFNANGSAEGILVPVVNGNYDDYAILVKTEPVDVTFEGFSAPGSTDEQPTGYIPDLVHGNRYTKEVFGIPWIKSGEQTIQIDPALLIYEFSGTGSTVYAASEIVPSEAGTYALIIKDGTGNVISRTIPFEISHKMVTVSFETNGGTPVSGQSAECCSLLDSSRIPQPKKDGFDFSGWYADQTLTRLWNFDQNTVGENTTLYAKWAKTYAIQGIVWEYEKAALAEGAEVLLMRGNTVICSAISNGDGRYYFEKRVPAGFYNVVAKFNGTTQTAICMIPENTTQSTIEMEPIILPQANVNSVLSVSGEDTPNVVVGGLDEGADRLKEAEVRNADTDKTVVSVVLTMNIKKEEKKTAETEKQGIMLQIESAAQANSTAQVDFLGIDVEKTVTVTTTEGTKTKDPVGVKNTETELAGAVFEVLVPYDMGNKKNLKILRHHKEEGEAGRIDVFRELAESEYALIKGKEKNPEDGTFFFESNSGNGAGIIHIFAAKFSTYAIISQEESKPVDPTPPGGGGGGGGGGTVTYAITAAAGEHGVISGAGVTMVTANQNMTYTITPASGYEVADVLVDNVSVGAVTSYTFEKVKAAHTISVTFKRTGAAANRFIDVNAGDWFYDSVDYVVENGLMNGVTETTFKPLNNTTRGMIVAILYRLSGKPAVSGDCPFTDVARYMYYKDAITWAAANGVVTGYNAKEFKPDSPITREQLAAILYRYAGFKGYDVTATSSLSKYKDADKIHAYAVPAIAWANAEGLLTGYKDGRVDPQGNALRAQVAAILQRFCENVVK